MTENERDLLRARISLGLDRAFLGIAAANLAWQWYGRGRIDWLGILLAALTIYFAAKSEKRLTDLRAADKSSTKPS